MTFALVLALTVLACFLLKRPIHDHPAVLYVFAIVVDGVYLAAELIGVPYGLWVPLFMLVQKCMLALALFTVVMFIGCFPRTSRVSFWLRPVRAELSIAACLLSAGHMASYLGTYVASLLAGSARGNVAIAFVVAMALLVLILVLGVTSLHAVKRRMKSDTWTCVQRWAYPFFALAYVHVALMLAPSALGGGASAQESLAVYTAVFGVYAVARIARALTDAQVKGIAELHEGSQDPVPCFDGEEAPAAF
ncbi:hypothetical protein VJ923_01945 [Adlercreutzia sp. R25]|uniref:hypothetical protein n=1 Tax=Adlercreutzia shanghongiae TaxID=3111773 RepID=UPI002DB93CDE|nr:hypothetical protein [Adlercreutzia sp. R25]MEC4271922.1 hypothetical protein [Adlercreutzia sp. R25]